MAITYKHGNVGKSDEIRFLQWVGQVLSPSENNHCHHGHHGHRCHYYKVLSPSEKIALACCLLVEFSQPVGDGVIQPIHLNFVPFLLIDVRTNL